MTVQSKVTTGIADHHGAARTRSTPEPSAGAARRRPSTVAVSDAAQAGQGRRAGRRSEGRPPGADRGLDRGLRWPRRRLGRQLQGRRGARRLARRRRRRLAGGGRLRLLPAPVPGRPDRQDRVPAALRRARHLRRDPAPRRHADLEDDRRGQQGPRGADLRARRLRRRGRPVQGRPAADRGDPQAAEVAPSAATGPSVDQSTAGACRRPGPGRRGSARPSGGLRSIRRWPTSTTRRPRRCSPRRSPRYTDGARRASATRRRCTPPGAARAAGRGVPRADRGGPRRPARPRCLHQRRHRGRQPRRQGPLLGAARRRPAPHPGLASAVEHHAVLDAGRLARPSTRAPRLQLLEVDAAGRVDPGRRCGRAARRATPTRSPWSA